MDGSGRHSWEPSQRRSALRSFYRSHGSPPLHREIPRAASKRWCQAPIWQDPRSMGTLTDLIFGIYPPSTMDMRSLRHPVLALLGGFLLLGFGATDALGMRACLHHAAAHSEEGAGSPGDHHSRDAEHGVDAHQATHGHDHSVAHEGPSPDPHSSHDTCECGVFCGGAAPPPPARTGQVAPAPAGDPAPRVSEDAAVRLPSCCIPHLLPFSQAPPSHS